jgi:hypothetical protein
VLNLFWLSESAHYETISISVLPLCSSVQTYMECDILPLHLLSQHSEECVAMDKLIDCRSACSVKRSNKAILSFDRPATFARPKILGWATDRNFATMIVVTGRACATVSWAHLAAMR